MTLIELVAVMALIGAMLAIGLFTMEGWNEDQRVKSAARSIGDAFSLARAEAIRSGSNHIVAFPIEAGLAGITAPVVIVNDGPSTTSNCRIDAGEIIQTVPAEAGVLWGTDAALANGTPAPDDAGGSGNQSTGSSFTDASMATPASWVMFQPDGIPRAFTQNAVATPPCTNVGQAGQGGGAIYVTNGRRDYAVVLSPLGAVRLHAWNPSGGWNL